MGGFDARTAGAAISAPGMDTRQWVTFGTVVRETPDNPSVDFTDQGPLVGVKLHPSGYEVPCRIANSIAGNGEGEYSPFIEGDEVIVVVPRGSERAGCTIVGRLNNEIDAWPKQVAGQDATKNSFAFRRIRTPYIFETSSSYLLYSAQTKAFFSLSPTGDLTLSNADAAFFALHSDMITIQNADGDLLLQFDTKEKTIHLEAQGTKFVLHPTSDSMLMVQGRLFLGSSGNLPLGHAVTIESLSVLLHALLLAIGVTQPGAVTGAALAGAAPAIVNAALATAVALPVGPFLAAITAGLGTPPDPLGIKPGIGVSGILLG